MISHAASPLSQRIVIVLGLVIAIAVAVVIDIVIAMLSRLYFPQPQRLTEAFEAHRDFPLPVWAPARYQC